MQKRILTVLLIEDSPQYARLVQHWLSGETEGSGFLLNWTDSLAAGMSRLEKGGVDVILLDLGLPDCTGMETYTQTRARAPKTPILILSSADSETLALQMIREGAEDYLVKSNCDADALIRAVRYAIVRRKSQQSEAPAPAVLGRTIGVVGAKGGVGTTTIASNLASELRRQTNQKVLLADLDSNGGNVSFLTGVECKYSVQDAISNLERLDSGFWNSLVAQAPDGFDMIFSAGPSGDGGGGAANLLEVLRFAQPLYQWTVLDLGRLSPASLTLLGTVSEVFLATTAALPSLYNAKRLIEALRTTIEADRIRLIVNRIGQIQPLSPGELNSMFGVAISASIPDDAAELHNACIDKRLPGSRSSVREAIAGLARQLTGLPEQPPKGKMLSLISLGERFRKMADRTASSPGART